MGFFTSIIIIPSKAKVCERDILDITFPPLPPPNFTFTLLTCFFLFEYLTASFLEDMNLVEGRRVEVLREEEEEEEEKT